MTGPSDAMSQDNFARLRIVCLDNIGPTRVRWLLEHTEPAVVVERLMKGLLPSEVTPAPKGVTKELVSKWGQELRRVDGPELLQQHLNLGIQVMMPDDPLWPFHEDPEPPGLLFFAGDASLLEIPMAIGVVGTRRCTSVGRSVAFSLGRGLAEAGVAVVSGLALGVDGAAHRGALEVAGPAIGVVGSGLDVVYPGGNRQLWGDVASAGLLVSEAPAGARPKRWRFPARNRLIAGLSIGLVIVESHARGGALLTVDESVDRGRAVFAVPGSVLSPASDGTNSLLVEGAIPVRGAEDVLGHLGMTTGPAVTVDPIDAEPDGVLSPAVDALDQVILAEVATGPVHLDTLVHSANTGVVEVTAAVQRMVADGILDLDGSTVSRI